MTDCEERKNCLKKCVTYILMFIYPPTRRYVRPGDCTIVVVPWPHLKVFYYGFCNWRVFIMCKFVICICVYRFKKFGKYKWLFCTLRSGQSAFRTESYMWHIFFFHFNISIAIKHDHRTADDRGEWHVCIYICTGTAPAQTVRDRSLKCNLTFRPRSRWHLRHCAPRGDYSD